MPISAGLQSHLFRYLSLSVTWLSSPITLALFGLQS